MLKKIMIAFIILIAAKQAVRAQFKVNGNIGKLPDGQVTLVYYTANGRQADSVPVTQGRFSLKGNLPVPDKVTLLFKPGFKRIDFYLENKEITITGHADSLDQLVITGSTLQQDYEVYKKEFKQLQAVSDRLYPAQVQMTKTGDTLLASLMQNIVLDFSKLVAQFNSRFIASHPNNHISLEKLYGLINNQEYSVLNNLFHMLDTSLQQSHMGRRIASLIAVKKKTAIGQPALPFSQSDTSGNLVTLEQFRGKYLLIDFWASWCKPCRAENPNLLKAYNKFKAKGLQVLGISLDQDKNQWLKAIAEDNLPWQHVSDLKGGQNKAADDYGVITIPSNVLINPQGIIIARNLRAQQLHQVLANLIN